MRYLYRYPGAFRQLPDGRLMLPRKSVTGLAALRAASGREFFAAADIEPTDAIASDWAVLDEYPWLHAITWAPGGERAALVARSSEIALIMAVHRPHNEWLLDLGVPVSLGSENPLVNRMAILAASDLTPMALWRARLGLLRREPIYRRMARAAAGVECNGPAAVRAYGHLAKRVFEYNDSRITDADLVAARAFVPDADRRLHVAFSGRWVAIKGVDYVVRAALLARERRLPIRFSMLGSGELEARLRAEAGDVVEFVGHLDFEREWKPFVREQVDVMLLPHVQGDPAGTYFEALGCGVPLVGFHNPSLTPLVDAGLGWAVRRGDTAALVDVLESLVARRDVLAQRRASAIAYMVDRTTEKTTTRRVAYLGEVGR